MLGTFRIAVIGDSMAFGAGLPYRHSLGARLGVLLNAALPEHWVETLTFGVSGGCLWHAVGRSLTQALPLQSDIVVLALCRNDALLLGPEPPDSHAVGRSWLQFAEFVTGGLATFRDRAQAVGARALVLYLDSWRQAGDVCIPEELGKACLSLGLPYLDGSAALEGYPQDLAVSEVDPHLNAVAHDIVARRLAQFLVSRRWTPASKGFEDATWIDSIRALGEARIEAGLPAVLSVGETLSILESKWSSRRNTSRSRHESHYASLRQRLLGEHRARLSRLAAEVVSNRLRSTAPLVRLTGVESDVNQAIALALALEQWVLAGSQPAEMPPASYLTHDATAPVDHFSVEPWQQIRRGAEELLASLCKANIADDARYDSAGLQYLLFWFSRVAQWCSAVDECAARYLDLLPRLVGVTDPTVLRCLGWLRKAADGTRQALTQLQPLVVAIATARQNAARAAGSTSLMLRLLISARPGQDVWSFGVAVESYAPAFTESQVATGYLVRDDLPHVFQVDIPLMFAGRIHVRMWGRGLSATNDDVRVSGLLCWPSGDLPEVDLPAIAVDDAGTDTVGFVFRDVRSIAFGV